MKGYYQVGDRVTMEVCRNYSVDDDGIISGGTWMTKTGTVVMANDYNILVEFDDGDRQVAKNLRGANGFPGRNVQPAK